MIERVWLDAAGEPLLHLRRRSRQEVLAVTEERLPELLPVGAVEEVPGTGLFVYVGNDALRAGVYGVTLATHGQRHEHLWALQREVLAAAVKTRAIWRSTGEVLPVASFLRLGRTFKGSAMSGGAVTAEFQAAAPYWWGREGQAALTSGTPLALDVDGQAPAPLRLDIAGPSGDVSIQSSAGLTVWRGSVTAGQILNIDGRPGRWSVTLAGASGAVDVSRFLSGPQPYLSPGTPQLTVTAGAGAAITATWQEGFL